LARADVRYEKEVSVRTKATRIERNAVAVTGAHRRIRPALVEVSRAIAASWRAFARQTAYESERGVVLALGWCSPWLWLPVAEGEPLERRKEAVVMNDACYAAAGTDTAALCESVTGVP
jgi:hypothetical protein